MVFALRLRAAGSILMNTAVRRLLQRREKLVSDYKAVETMPESEIIE